MNRIFKSALIGTGLFAILATYLLLSGSPKTDYLGYYKLASVSAVISLVDYLVIYFRKKRSAKAIETFS